MRATKKKIAVKELTNIKEKNVGSVDYAFIYENLKKKYSSTKKPVEVNFRKLVNTGIDRYTHLLHTYPAKLLTNIPYFFINCSSLVKKNSVILDPFCGSGTVLLESIISGRKAFGADANPLARLISKAKTTPIDTNRLKILLSRILSKSKKTKKVISPQNLLNWSLWYSKKSKGQLGKLYSSIKTLKNLEERIFFEACFSSCARKVSFADPCVSVPVRLNPNRYSKNKKKEVRNYIKKIESLNVFNVFQKIAESNIKKISSLYKLKNLGSVQAIYDDAKNLTEIKNNSIDLIITSPPYAGAQKYIRASSLNIGWLGLSPDNTLRALEKKNIGREHYNKSEYDKALKVPIESAQNLLNKIFKINPLRAYIAANYLLEMQKALNECHRVLKKNSTLILIAGNNVVCGHNFQTQKYLKEICKAIGFRIELVLRDNIHSRGLMTKRNKTASIIMCEWITILKKN